MSKKIAILTDSTCDLPLDYQKQHDVYVIPQILIWGEESIKDNPELTQEKFFNRLTTDPIHPQTSQPSVGDFAAFYEQIKADGADEIVSVHVSSGLSGTINSANGAQSEVDIPVHVVDSKAASLGLGCVVMAAVQAREAGGDAQAIVAAAEKRVENTRVVLMVDTLEFLHKGGRIGGAKRLLGTALNLKPVLHLEDGVLEPKASVRTRSKALERILEEALDGLSADKPLGGAVVHARAEDDANMVAARYKEMHNPQEFMISGVTPIIGVHTGPGVVGVITYYM